MNASNIRSLARKLAEARKFALTTLTNNDERYGRRLATADRRGDNELLLWGLGPDLDRGDIVAMYTPLRNKWLPEADRGVVRRIYTIPERIHGDGGKFNRAVFLYRRVTLERPLSFKDMTDVVGFNRWFACRAGWTNTPVDMPLKCKFWNTVLARQPHFAGIIRERLFEARTSPRVAISYSGRDHVFAQALMAKLEAARLRTFFATSVDDLMRFECTPIRKLLAKQFGRARLGLFISPLADHWSRWIDLELATLREARLPILQVLLGPDRVRIGGHSAPLYSITVRANQEQRVVRRLVQILDSLQSGPGPDEATCSKTGGG